jgi:uncharacterized protein
MSNGLTIETVRGSIVHRAKWRDGIARHELIVFFALAFLFSWYPWIIALAQGRTSGPNPLGPFVAALVVAGIASGKHGLRDMLGRIVRVRFPLRWYFVILGLPVLICSIALGVMGLFGKAPALPGSSALRELPDRFIFIFLFIGLGEEPGWRGFALPRLQRGGHSPVIASLILAPIWAVWHLPLLGNEFAPAVIPAFLISLLAGTLIQTWIFNRTRGSVFAQMLFHATVNTVGSGLVFPLMKGPDFVTFWYVYALLWLAAGLAISTSRSGGLRTTSGLSETTATVSNPVPTCSASVRIGDLSAIHPRPDRT